MGGIILIASILIWFLGYFPRETEQGKIYESQIEHVNSSNTLSEKEKTETVTELNRLKNMEHQQNSYIGRIGQAIQPALAPLGFDW